MSRLASRLVATTGAAALAVVAAAGPALAHVSVTSADAEQGGFGVITFRVPNETESTNTTEVKVQLPADQPLGSVSVEPKSGWTYTVQKAKLATPIKTDDGDVTEAVSVIDWKAAAGAAIKPGEFGQFSISAGPLPKAGSMQFKAIQFYSDGKQVQWIDEQAPGSTDEPEHPAPTLLLPAASGGTGGGATAGPTVSATPGAPAAGAPAAPAASSDSASSGSVVGAYVVAALGVLIGLAGLAVGLGARRRRDNVVAVESARSVGAGAE
ncbi:MAG: hypothetical protein V7637_3950 [Mycobacteriales bacterium]|jgi:uncharacterized protein YcnI